MNAKEKPEPQQCQWFAYCDNEATHDHPHPILGAVPCCDRCAKIVEENT